PIVRGLQNGVPNRNKIRASVLISKLMPDCKTKRDRLESGLVRRFNGLSLFCNLVSQRIFSTSGFGLWTLD
ncbi:MAG: hypothetical protein M3371_12715, partial [Acidobacteriota bacterium]|nr:hypothetical protein [Acidobacteriota bacterium]